MRALDEITLLATLFLILFVFGLCLTTASNQKEVKQLQFQAVENGVASWNVRTDGQVSFVLKGEIESRKFSDAHQLKVVLVEKGMAKWVVNSQGEVSLEWLKKEGEKR